MVLSVTVHTRDTFDECEIFVLFVYQQILFTYQNNAAVVKLNVYKSFIFVFVAVLTSGMFCLGKTLDIRR